MSTHQNDSVQSTARLLKFFDRDHIWLITGIALSLRLALFFYIAFSLGNAGFILAPFSDGNGYVTIANNVLEGRGFSLEETAPFAPDIKRVPLYPLYLAATFALTGGAWWLAALLQTFMGAGLVYLIYRVTQHIGGSRAAFFAALFAALYPFAIFLATQLLTETLFTLMLFGAFALFVHTLSSPSFARIALGGALFGLATLVKPAAQYIAFLLLPLIALSQRGLQRATYPLIFLICFVAIISPWIARNYHASGNATISFEANILFDLHAAGYMAYKETGEAGRAAEYRTATTVEQILETPRSEFIRRLVEIGVSDPIGFSKYLAISTVPFIFGDGFVTMVTALSPHQALPAWNFSTSLSALAKTLGFGVVSPWLIFLSLASKAFWAVVLLCAAIGFIGMIRDRGPHLLMAASFLLVIAYFMFAGGPVQSARYRAPVEPLIFLMAGLGAASLMRAYEIHAVKRSSLPSRTK